MKTASALTFAAVVLAGCTASGDTTKRFSVAATTVSQKPVVAAEGSSTIDGTVDMGTPRVTAAGPSPISPDKQPAFCQDQVAYTFSTEPQYVATRERVVAVDNSTTIDVTVDKGNQVVETFKCRLDASGRFIDVMAMTSDGAL